MESLYRKYRPQTFDDMVGQQHIVGTLRNALSEGRQAHAYLFCGPRGTGKTTTARVLAKALLCECGPTPSPDGSCEQCRDIAEGTHPDVFELDAASRTGVDNVREEIINRVAFAPTRGRYKVYIIDEVHMLTTQAFNALLKTLEEPPAHVVFVLCTTDPQKVPETILSRCQRLEFHRISTADIEQRLAYVCESEGFAYDREALSLVARHSRGGLRDALSMLEQLSVFGDGAVRLEDAQATLGEVSGDALRHMLEAIADRNVAQCFADVAELADRGADMAQYTRDLTGYTRDVYVAGITGGAQGVIESGEDPAVLLELAQRFGDTDRLSRMLDILGQLAAELRGSVDQRLSLEVALTRMARPASDLTLEALADRVAILEQRLASGEFGAPAPTDATVSSRGPAMGGAVVMGASTPSASGPVPRSQLDIPPRPRPRPTSPGAPDASRGPAVQRGDAQQKPPTTRSGFVPPRLPRRDQQGAGETSRPQPMSYQAAQGQPAMQDQPFAQGYGAQGGGMPSHDMREQGMPAADMTGQSARTRAMEGAAPQPPRSQAPMAAEISDARGGTVSPAAAPRENPSVAPTPDAEEAKRLWGQVVDQVSQVNASVSGLLRTTEGTLTAPDTLTIVNYGSSFVATMIERPGQREVIERAVSQVYGRRLNIRVVAPGGASSDLASQAASSQPISQPAQRPDLAQSSPTNPRPEGAGLPQGIPAQPTPPANPAQRAEVDLPWTEPTAGGPAGAPVHADRSSQPSDPATRQQPATPSAVESAPVPRAAPLTQPTEAPGRPIPPVRPVASPAPTQTLPVASNGGLASADGPSQQSVRASFQVPPVTVATPPSPTGPSAAATHAATVTGEEQGGDGAIADLAQLLSAGFGGYVRVSEEDGA